MSSVSGYCRWRSGGFAVLAAGLVFCLGARQLPDLQGRQAPANAVWVDSLNLSKMIQGYGDPRAGKSVDGNPIRLKGITYPHGIGTHAESEFLIDLTGSAVRFLAMVGVDDEKAGQGSVVFQVWVDNKKAFDSGILRGGDAPKQVSVDLTGARRLRLHVGDAGDGISSDHADWAGAMLILAPDAKARPAVASVPTEEPRIYVPPVHPQPAIHGPRITGATPGRPFLFLIPATGRGPFTFSARNLPDGLTLDSKTGIITGSLKRPGSSGVLITVRSPGGSAARKLTIVGGEHRLSLTPPMGWNSWNVWAGAVNADRVRAAADWMVKSGLAAHGFQYVNIDDCWEGQRAANGDIQTNSRFGDMKALADYVHGLGLKLGIYSSPGPKTCAGFEASYNHEEQDARIYAKWGIDYLKYDWCSYGNIARNDNSLPALQKPYRVMRTALDHVDRDIVYSLCQYGMGNVWEWGAAVGGNCWRTTGDITDTWGSLSGIYRSQAGHEKYAGPGHWNDPDMLVVGRVGWGNPHPSRLTPNEQILHITLWALVASPLLIGCDMANMDAFTVAVLSNDEVLDVNQDPLGKAAGRRGQRGAQEVWARPLFDGTWAVGLINGGMEAAPITVDLNDLGFRGYQPIRDLWLHRNLGTFQEKFTEKVPAHGAVMIKVGRPQKNIYQ